MATSIRTETETVVKRVLPYLRRRGYDPESDIDFETAVKSTDPYSKGYVDLLVHCGRAQPLFLIEAKRSGKTLHDKDRDQAVGYGASLRVPFVVVTNGTDILVFNPTTSAPIKWDGKLAAKIPTKDRLPHVIKFLKANRGADDVPLDESAESLPYRPALPLKQLNGLFARCHNRIRDIEKNEEHAFADFSKLLFLRLLEEKADDGDIRLPYSYRFFELAEKPSAEADQLRDAITKMLEAVRGEEYGDVLIEPLYLKKPQTFQYLVKELASVSFEDSGLDTKGLPTNNSVTLMSFRIPCGGGY
jgi:type I restriction enzyme M protein